MIRMSMTHKRSPHPKVRVQPQIRLRKVNPPRMPHLDQTLVCYHLAHPLHTPPTRATPQKNLHSSGCDKPDR